MEVNRGSQYPGQRRGGFRGGYRGRGQRFPSNKPDISRSGASGSGNLVSNSALGSSDFASSREQPPHASQWQPSEGRGGRSFRGNARISKNVVDSVVPSRPNESILADTAPWAWSSRGGRGRGRGRYVKDSWGGQVGRSDDENWRLHGGRSLEKYSPGQDVASSGTGLGERQDHVDAGHLTVAAAEFVPRVAPRAAEAPMIGPYSFIALSPSGQPVTMILQPSLAPASFMPVNSSTQVFSQTVTRQQDSATNVDLSARKDRANSSLPLSNINLHPPGTDADDLILEQSGIHASEEVPSTNSHTTKVLSPKDAKLGYSRITHRGSSNVQNNALPNPVPEKINRGQLKEIGSKSATERVPEKKLHDPRRNSDDRYLSSRASSKSGLNFAPKKILSREEKNVGQPFTNNDSDFPALDRKFKEMKLEAEAREEAPVTWRRSLEPKIDGGSKAKASYATGCKYVGNDRKQSKGERGETSGLKAERDEEVQDEFLETTARPSFKGDGEGEGVAETDESAPEKRKRRRRRRRRRPADSNAEIDDDDDVDKDDVPAKPVAEIPLGAGSHQRDVSVENLAVKIRIENSTAAPTATIVDGDVKEGSIFKDDDFPDVLVDFRRPFSGLPQSRKVPRVIGSKVTKLGAGKPLAKTVNEWTDMSDEMETKQKGAGVKGGDKPAVPGGAWGNAASHSFAEVLKMAARTPVAPSEAHVGSDGDDEEGTIKTKRKRKRKKKGKSDSSVPTPTQPVKKSKAPLTFDLAALVPKKVESSGKKNTTKKSTIKNNAPETVPATIKFRGKEREKPKAKRPSKMKRVIMTERQLLRQRRELLLKLQAALHAPHAQFVAGSKNIQEHAPPPLPQTIDGSELKSGSVVVTSQCDEISIEKEVWSTTDAESDDDVVGSSKENRFASDVSVKLGLENSIEEIAIGGIVEESSEESSAKLDVKNVTEDNRIRSSAEKSTNERDRDIEASNSKLLEEKVTDNLQQLQGEDLRIKHWGPKALHNRKFREYCTHFVDSDLNALVKSLMLELMRFQDKIYHKEKEASVNMFKTKRRFFNGLREILKYIKLRKLRLLIVASDVESIKSSGGLDDVMNQILQEAKEQRVFTVFTMSRFALGKILKKPVPVSCVGVRDYGGCESIIKDLKKKVEEKTKEYDAKAEEIRARERMDGPSQDAPLTITDNAVSATHIS